MSPTPPIPSKQRWPHLQTSVDVWGWTEPTQTTQHNTNAQWERSSNSPLPALVVSELWWYEKKNFFFKTKEEEETEEQERGRKRESERERERKSHEIKQSEPRARQRSDCVAEWVILLHLLPQQGVVSVCGFGWGVRESSEKESERGSI